MAKAFQCERCEAFEAGTPTRAVNITVPGSSNPTGATSVRCWELCTPCDADLNDFLYAKKRNPDAPEEPA